MTKDKFERTMAHVNVSTIGHVDCPSGAANLGPIPIGVGADAKVSGRRILLATWNETREIHMRIRRLVGRFTALVLAAGAFMLTAPALAAPLYSGLYVFGDSLSDNGNLYGLTGGAMPAEPYWDGRFSNGPVAAEVLAQGLGLGSGAFHDMAIGGAQTGSALSIDMGSQLDVYFMALGSASADPDALYLVWGGANDLRGGAALQPTVQNLVDIVGALYTKGARNFLLPNIPDLGLTPEGLASGNPGGATALSEAFNSALAVAYAGLADALDYEHFFYFDVMELQREIVGDPSAFGFSNVSTSCMATSGCDPDTFLYWDNIHPTAAAHRILGQAMLAVVPEPQTLLLVLLAVAMMLRFTARKASATVTSESLPLPA